MPKSTPKTTHLIPLGDRILIDAPPPLPKGELRKVGELYMPLIASNATNADLEPTHMIVPVLAAGHKCDRVKKGDRIIVTKMNCSRVKYHENGPEHYMVRESDVVAIVP